MPVPLVFGVGLAIAGLFADVTLDKVAAVVGTKPIFLSELRRRSRPHFYRIDFMGGDAKERDAAKQKTMHEVLERMIDERLEEVEADKAKLISDDSEIEAGIKQVSTQAKMTPAELIAEAKKQGMTEADYRAEIRRQIIQGKLVNLRVRMRVKVTDADARQVYATWAKEQSGPNAPVDLRIIVLSVPKDATPDVKKAKEELANQVAKEAKSGTDFCSLVTKHSDDKTTQAACGSRGPMVRAYLLADIAKASASLKPGEVASPISFTDPTGSSAYLVIQMSPTSKAPVVPAFEKVKDQMIERANLEATERERKKWLADLRQGNFIEVKL